VVCKQPPRNPRGLQILESCMPALTHERLLMCCRTQLSGLPVATDPTCNSTVQHRAMATATERWGRQRNDRHQNGANYHTPVGTYFEMCTISTWQIENKVLRCYIGSEFYIIFSRYKPAEIPFGDGGWRWLEVGARWRTQNLTCRGNGPSMRRDVGELNHDPE
jgi:hypothetical protein